MQGKQNSRCTQDIFYSLFTFATEGNVDLTEAMKRIKNIFWFERKMKRALLCISGAGRKPLADDTSCLSDFRFEDVQRL